MDSAVLFAEAESLLRHARPETKNFIFIYTIDTHPPYGGKPPQGDACLRDARIARSRFCFRSAPWIASWGHSFKPCSSILTTP